MKMYVLVLKSLPKSQQAVQAGHALAEYLLNFKTEWDNGVLIYLQANEEELEKFFHIYNFVPFFEEDLGGKLTAVCGTGMNDDPRFIDNRLV